MAATIVTAILCITAIAIRALLPRRVACMCPTQRILTTATR